MSDTNDRLLIKEDRQLKKWKEHFTTVSNHIIRSTVYDVLPLANVFNAAPAVFMESLLAHIRKFFIFPSDWKEIVKILKKACPLECYNWRGICELPAVFIDFEKAFSIIHREWICNTVHRRGIPEKRIGIFKQYIIVQNNTCCIKVRFQNGTELQVTRGWIRLHCLVLNFEMQCSFCAVIWEQHK